jgi:prepilin-type N-terminal cleavage/methylation domain-containing protein
MRKYGVTLVELLVALAILGVLVAAFTGFFVSTLRATSDFDRRNELLLDGQIAHQLLVSRLQEACLANHQSRFGKQRLDGGRPVCGGGFAPVAGRVCL